MPRTIISLFLFGIWVDSSDCLHGTTEIELFVNSSCDFQCHACVHKLLRFIGKQKSEDIDSARRVIKMIWIRNDRQIKIRRRNLIYHVTDFVLPIFLLPFITPV